MHSHDIRFKIWWVTHLSFCCLYVCMQQHTYSQAISLSPLSLSLSCSYAHFTATTMVQFLWWRKTIFRISQLTHACFTASTMRHYVHVFGFFCRRGEMKEKQKLFPTNTYACFTVSTMIQSLWLCTTGMSTKWVFMHIRMCVHVCVCIVYE